mgnify:CR=1 FL=1
MCEYFLEVLQNSEVEVVLFVAGTHDIHALVLGRAITGISAFSWSIFNLIIGTSHYTDCGGIFVFSVLFSFS